MRILATLLFISTALLFSCNKNQRTTNELEGTWNVTGFFFNSDGAAMQEGDYNSIAEDNETMRYTFEPCNLKNEEPCICEWYKDDGFGYITEITYDYRVIEEGEKMRMIGTSETDTWVFTSRDKKSIEMYNISSNGSRVTVVMEKVD